MPIIVTRSSSVIPVEYSGNSICWNSPGPASYPKDAVTVQPLTTYDESSYDLFSRQPEAVIRHENGMISIRPNMKLNSSFLEELYSKKRLVTGVSAENIKFWQEHLPNMTALKCLDVGGRLSIKFIELLNNLKNLNQLKLDTVIAPSLEVLTNLKELTHLALFFSRNSVELKHVLSSKKLITVSLSLPSGFYSLSEFKKLKLNNLKSLELGSCSESRVCQPSEINSVANISSLKYLSLFNMKVDERSLDFVEMMPNLEVVRTVVPKHKKYINDI